MHEYEELENTIKQINSLEEVEGVLSWDQEVIMSDKGIKARSKQMSLLSELKHDIISQEKLGNLLDQLEDDKEELDEEKRANLREFKRKREREVKVPKELKKDISETASESVKAWSKAKEENDFELFLPHLEKMIKLKREYAEHIDPDEEPYKVLFRDYEPYISFERMEKILEELKKELTTKLEKIRESDVQLEKDAFKSEFEEEKQNDLAKEIMTDLGYDWDKGNLHTSDHPFTMGNPLDARITTRYDRNNLAEGFMAVVHETGHALYEQGLLEKHHGLPMGQSREVGFHESQSKLLEDQIGRSLAFWKYATPIIKEKFGHFDSSVRDCYESVNQVKPENKIRIEADELTYHLHIVLRFELGKKLINGDLEPENLPEAWNNKMEELLDVRPENNSEGCLQDIHWAWGNFGYFPTYSQGSILAAQIFNQMKKDIDGADEKIEAGEFGEIVNWLNENVHQHGRRYKTEKLVEEITGEKPTAKYFLEYVDRKYGELYQL